MVYEYYILTWLAAARPPVHPEPMKGTQRFDTLQEAYSFFKKQPHDAKFVSLVSVKEEHIDLTETVKFIYNDRLV